MNRLRLLMVVLTLVLGAVPASAAESLDYRLLDRQLTGPEDAYRWHAFVTSRAELQDVWERYRLRGDIPNIPFNRRVAVLGGTGGSSSCPFRMGGLRLDRDDRRIIMRLRYSNAEGGCTDDFIPTTYVTSVRRTDIPRGELTVRVRTFS